MPVTHGHGNPSWTRDEVILALGLYLDCDGTVPGPSDPRVQELSELLRAFPHHTVAARKPSFRNPDGVGFKLQNLRKLATGKGLKNVSRTDHEVWDELGDKPERVRELASLIRAGIAVTGGTDEIAGAVDDFAEGRVVTETHLRRERNPALRKMLLEQRRESSSLRCDVCGCSSPTCDPALEDAIFEAHHIVPLAHGSERRTRLTDLALVCANCHRVIHRAIAQQKQWISIAEARKIVDGA